MNNNGKVKWVKGIIITVIAIVIAIILYTYRKTIQSWFGTPTIPTNYKGTLSELANPPATITEVGESTYYGIYQTGEPFPDRRYYVWLKLVSAGVMGYWANTFPDQQLVVVGGQSYKTLESLLIAVDGFTGTLLPGDQ